MDEHLEVCEQPAELKNLLASLNAARRSLSLYGPDHASSLNAIQESAIQADEYSSRLQRATFVFTKKSIIVNDHQYPSSPDSEELFNRLRARGVMAVTFVEAPPADQLSSFLLFLNEDPKQVRLQGGACSYLCKCGVGKIVATECIYLIGDEDEENPVERLPQDFDEPDRVISAAIDWLSRQDEEEDPKPPRLPIWHILSNPDMSARLIREAVTKLHASRRQYTSGELAGEVINDLKDLAEANQEEWDRATPQIRAAISKLPKEMRPAISGFTDESEEIDSTASQSNPGKIANIPEVEQMVSEAFSHSGNVGENRMPDPAEFEQLFGAKANGLLTCWRRELQPTSVILSSGKTLKTLMEWESAATEHGRICQALATLVLRAAEMNDHESAMTFVLSLARESRDTNDSMPWRSTNASAALASLNSKTLTAIIKWALQSGDYKAKEGAAVLVSAMPNFAIELAPLIGTSGAELFNEALRRALMSAGQSAVGVLGGLLCSGTPAARNAALEMLVDIAGNAAVREIAPVLEGADVSFAIQALKVLPRIRVPLVTEICLEALTHSSPEMRCAALNALGELGYPASVPTIVRIATRNSAGGDDAAERIAAIQALARIGDDESHKALRDMANRHPLIGRSRYEVIRLAAERALQQIDSPEKAA